MAAAAGVFACVAIGRRVATTRNAASLAGSKVHPPRTSLHTLVALANLRLLDRRHDSEVIARLLGFHFGASLLRDTW